MENINVVKLQKLINTLQTYPNYKEILKELKQKYKKNCFDQELSVIMQKSIRINQRQHQKITGNILEKQKEATYYFAFEQHKIFCWVLGVFCYLNNKTLSSLDQNDITEIHTIFSERRNRLLIKYEIQNMIYKPRTKPDWSGEQIQLLNDIMQYQDTDNEWKMISLKLFIRSNGKYLRPAHQCREKWVNYLNPNMQKFDWTVDEDIKLLESVELIGCKWAAISRDLYPFRNEHCVKNRYNSLVTQWKKRNPNFRQNKVVQNIIKSLKSKRGKSSLRPKPLQKAQLISKQSEAQLNLPIPLSDPKEEILANSTDNFTSTIEQENSDSLKDQGFSQVITFQKKEKIVLQNPLVIDDKNDEDEEFDINIKGNLWNNFLENQEKMKENHHYHKISVQICQFKTVDKGKLEKKTADQDENQFQQPVLAAAFGYSNLQENNLQQKPCFNFSNNDPDNSNKYPDVFKFKWAEDDKSNDWWQLELQEKKNLEWIEDFST